MDSSSLKIDLGNPESILQQIPEIENIVAMKRQEASEAALALEAWDGLLRRLRFLAGLNVRIALQIPPSDEALDAVVNVVEREGRRIMAIGVTEELLEEGHEIEGPDAVQRVMEMAAVEGRIRRIDKHLFAPAEWPTEEFNVAPMVAVPEAHLGLGGRPPKTKAEGVLRVLGSDPTKDWSAAQVGRVMVAQGWLSEAADETASLTATLSRLQGENKIFRPERGRYQLLAPSESAR
jgi:hypothetical protein